MQELFNDLSSDLIKEFIEAVDLEFKNSEKIKERFYINKSNVKRSIVTIFGEITFHRTLYQDKYTNEYYNYIDDVPGLEAYKTYDPIVRGILIQDSFWRNPSHTSSFSFLLTTKNKSLSLNIPVNTILVFIYLISPIFIRLYHIYLLEKN